MVNDHVLLRTFLASKSAITDLTSTRIYAGRDVPPEGWTPATGSCIVLKRRAHVGRDESGTFINVSFQFKCYGGGGNDNAQLIAAESLYRALQESLHFGTDYDVMGAQEEGSGGAPLREQDTGWPYTLAFFRVQLRKTA